MLIKTCNEINFPRAEVVYVWTVPSARSCVLVLQMFWGPDQWHSSALQTHGGKLSIS